MAKINKWEKPFHIERGDVYMGPINLDADPEKAFSGATGRYWSHRVTGRTGSPNL